MSGGTQGTPPDRHAPASRTARLTFVTAQHPQNSSLSIGRIIPCGWNVTFTRETAAADGPREPNGLARIRRARRVPEAAASGRVVVVTDLSSDGRTTDRDRFDRKAQSHGAAVVRSTSLVGFNRALYRPPRTFAAKPNEYSDHFLFFSFAISKKRTDNRGFPMEVYTGSSLGTKEHGNNNIVLYTLGNYTDFFTYWPIELHQNLLENI